MGQPIGKQDQYAAAFGGVNFFRFNPGGGVTVEPLSPPKEMLQALFDHMMVFWTSQQRDAGAVLREQKANTGRRLENLARMRDQAHELQT